MSVEKPLIFISHITEEKDVAILFKELIEQSFLGMIEVFVSSDEHSIQMGQKWLDQITVALKKCALEIIICSPQSIKRPWINFEAGAGWIREISVIPLCHSGAEPNKLPMPLNLLQAAKATEISSLKLIFPVLAQAIGSKTPNVDFSDFVGKIKGFELSYTFWNQCIDVVSIINRINGSILCTLKVGNSISVGLTETQMNLLGSYTEFLEGNNILKVQGDGSVSIGPGVLHGHVFTPLARFQEVINSEKLNIS